MNIQIAEAGRLLTVISDRGHPVHNVRCVSLVVNNGPLVAFHDIAELCHVKLLDIAHEEDLGHGQSLGVHQGLVDLHKDSDILIDAVWRFEVKATPAG